MKQVFVYVAGPISAGNPSLNVHHGVWAADYLLASGYTPFCPHLTYFWEKQCGRKTWETWLDYDEQWLSKCDVLLQLPGLSPGADREVEFAEALLIPVVHSIVELKERFPLT